MNEGWAEQERMSPSADLPRSLQAFPNQYFQSDRELRSAASPTMTDICLTGETPRKNLLCSFQQLQMVFADDRALWSVSIDGLSRKLLYPLEEGPVVKVASAFGEYIYVLTTSSLRVIEPESRPPVNNPIPPGRKFEGFRSSAVSLCASTAVPGECLVGEELGVSLYDIDRGCVAHVGDVAVVEDVAFSHLHPRVVYVATERLLRVDYRSSPGSLQTVAACSPPLYHGGLLTCLSDSLTSVDTRYSGDVFIKDTAPVWHWSAVSVNPIKPELVALASGRYRALGIFDLRKEGTPVAEYSLTKQCTQLVWSSDGTSLSGIQGREVFKIETMNIGTQSNFSYLQNAFLAKCDIVGMDWVANSNRSELAFIDASGDLNLLRLEK